MREEIIFRQAKNSIGKDWFATSKIAQLNFLFKKLNFKNGRINQNIMLGVKTKIIPIHITGPKST